MIQYNGLTQCDVTSRRRPIRSRSFVVRTVVVLVNIDLRPRDPVCALPSIKQFSSYSRIPREDMKLDDITERVMSVNRPCPSALLVDAEMVLYFRWCTRPLSSLRSSPRSMNRAWDAWSGLNEVSLTKWVWKVLTKWVRDSARVVTHAESFDMH